MRKSPKKRPLVACRIWATLPSPMRPFCGYVTTVRAPSRERIAVPLVRELAPSSFMF